MFDFWDWVCQKRHWQNVILETSLKPDKNCVFLLFPGPFCYLQQSVTFSEKAPVPSLPAGRRDAAAAVGSQLGQGSSPVSLYFGRILVSQQISALAAG